MPPRRWERVVDLLGKPFSIWALSSILVTGVGWVVAKAWEEVDLKAQRREEVRRIDIELSTRLLIAQDELATLKARVSAGLYAKTNYSFVLNYGRACLDGVPPPADGRHTGCPGIYPDWGNRTYLSLLTQLSVSVPAGERKELLEARERIRQLFVMASGPYVAEKPTSGVSQETIDESLAQVERAMLAYSTELALKRWR